MTDLKRVVELAERLQDKIAEFNSLKDSLEIAKAEMLRLEREDLPELMSEVGLEEFRLKDGTVVKITEDCSAAITDATRERALRWLIDNDFGGLIKTQVTVEFGRGDRESAEALAQELAESRSGVECKEAVHPSTLKAFVKEQMRDGKPIPMDLFNVYPYSKAVLKTQKR